MPRVRRILLPLLLLITPLPAAAQTAGNVVTPAPPPREGTVGPEQLRDFALPGTRTTPAQPEAAEPAPTARSRVAPPSLPEATRERPPSPEGTTARRAAPAPSARDAEPTRTVESEAGTAAAPSATGSSRVPAPSEAVAAEPGFTPSPPVTEPAAEPVSTSEPAPGPGPSLSWWPWAVVAALTGVALFLFLRRRRAPEDEGRLAFLEVTSGDAPIAEPRPAPSPVPSAEPQTPAAARAPLPTGLVTTRLNRGEAHAVDAAPMPAAAPAPVGLVSSRLRPWLEIDVGVLGIQLTDDEAIVQFEIELLNTGSVPARDIVVEVLPLNAGEEQDREIANFFGREMGSARGIDALAPLGRMSLRNEVRMPRGAIREYAVEGARVFVPVLAFTGAYHWSGGEGRTSAAWLLGRRSNGSDKLAPLRLDQGPRVFTSVGQKRLELAVRR